MPLYEYSDPETGKSVELHRPVEDRNKEVVVDGITLKRTKNIPDTLVVVGSRPTPEQSFDQNILKGYYRQEEREGSRFRSGYTKKQIGKAYEHVRSL